MRVFVFFALVLFSLGGVSALSSTLGDAYAPSETMIGQFSDDIIDIDIESANVVRDGHIDVGFNGDIKKLGDSYFVWLPAPLSSGSYTLIVENVIASVGGFPAVVDFEHDFTVEGTQTDYAISPGFVFSSVDFDIGAVLYEDFRKSISVDYPSTREVNLNPGNNLIDFEIEEFVGNQLITVNVGKYAVPAFLIGQDGVCGDGLLHGNEVCDGSNLDGKSCVTEGYDSGVLDCASDCLSFDFSGCEFDEEIVECDSEHLVLCLNNGDCTGASGFWYNNECNQYEEGAVCDSGHVGLCVTEGTCLDSNGFWYGGICNEEEEPSCSSDNLDACLTHGTCLDSNGFWYDDSCNAEERDVSVVVNTPHSFRFDPRRIRSTVLTSEGSPRYSFGIINLGGEKIEGLVLDYDDRKFIIEPSGVVDIEPNETAFFYLTFRDFTGAPERGVAIARVDDFSEYLLFDVSFTMDVEEVETEYVRGQSDQSVGYYCSELSGSICVGGEVCSGENVESIGSDNCCVGNCELPSKSRAWIGYLVAAILILILLIVYVNYKKAGKKPKVLTQRRFMEAEKKLP